MVIYMKYKFEIHICFIDYWIFYLSADSKDIINKSIQKYVLKLFKNKKNKESDHQKQKPIDKPIKSHLILNEIVCENEELSSLSSNMCFYNLFIQKYESIYLYCNG